LRGEGRVGDDVRVGEMGEAHGCSSRPV
jgi:hypothetical protein